MNVGKGVSNGKPAIGRKEKGRDARIEQPLHTVQYLQYRLPSSLVCGAAARLTHHRRRRLCHRHAEQRRGAPPRKHPH